jgi:hypothetical protein
MLNDGFDFTIKTNDGKKRNIILGKHHDLSKRRRGRVESLWKNSGIPRI